MSKFNASEIAISTMNAQSLSSNDRPDSQFRPDAMNSGMKRAPNDSTREDESAQMQQLLRLLRSSVVPAEDSGILAMRLEIEKLKLQKEENEQQRSHEEKMLKLKNQHDSEKFKSKNTHELAMKDRDVAIERLKLENTKEKVKGDERTIKLKIEADERRRREEKQAKASDERYLLAATAITTGTAAGAGAILGSACAGGIAVGVATMAAPIAIPLAVISGAAWAYKKASNPTSSS